MQKKLLIPFFLVGTIALMVVMAKTGTGLKTDAAPMGILDLEFAYNTNKTTPIIDSWIQAGTITAAKINTCWDFLFLFFYAGFLFLACNKISGKLTGACSKAGILIAKGALLAGLLDVLENAGMLLTLNNLGSSPIAFATTFFSVIKWGLAVIAVLYVLTGLLALVYHSIKAAGNSKGR